MLQKEISMSKAVKWLVGIVLVLVALVIIIPLTLPLLIDPNDYKETIAQKVKEQTGRSLAIPGKIDLDFSLIGLNTVFKMGEVRLSSSRRFPDTEFFASNHVEINLALWPLIKNKELIVNRIRLDGVNINLVKNEQGVGSWEDLTGGEPAGPAEEKPEKAGTGLAGIDIGGIKARNINLTYTDRQANRTVKLGNLNLELGRIRQEYSFPLQTDFELMVQEEKQEPLSAKIKSTGDVTFSLADRHYMLENFNLEGLVKNSSLPKGEVDFAISADIDCEMQQQKVDIRQLVFKSGQMEIKTMLAVTSLPDPQINGSLNVLPFSPRSQAETLGITLPVQGPQNLSNMSAELDFSGNLSAMHVSKVHLNVDETNIDGTFSVTNLLHPAYDLTLNIDQLDLDRYTAGTKGSQAEQEATPSPGPRPEPEQPEEPGGREVIPVEQLRGLVFDAELNIGKLKAAKLTATNIQLKASGRDGLIGLEPLAADFYDGAINVTADIDARQETPVVLLVNDLKGVRLGPIFMDLTGKEEITGRADIHADITSRGTTADELNRNANGKVNLSLADGEIARLKIIDTIRTAKALLGSKKQDEGRKTAATGAEAGQPAPVQQTGRPTTFASLTASGIITNGVFSNDDLLAESELMKVKGKGTVDFVNERIDYLLTIFLAKTIDRDRETGLVDLADTPIPYRVRGTFDKIEQSAALTEIVKTEAKKLLIKELEKQFGEDDAKGEVKKESTDSTKDLINKGLKSIFGK